MNKILSLFDEKFVIALFEKNILPQYPDFVQVKKVEIKPHKKLIWDTTYHVVFEFKTHFLTKDKKTKILEIFCSAHSYEPRKNVYDILTFLWSHNFAKGHLTIPHPLFYSEEFRATFYRGVKGYNLYYYIKEKNYQEVENIVVKAAAWFAKLHRLFIKKSINFNKENNRIATITPGSAYSLERIKDKHPQYYEMAKKIFETLINNEEAFFASTDKRWLIHGDAHPENIIKMSKTKIGVIDFTDICLSDFARDLGSFLQQIEYMTLRKTNDKQFVKKIKKLFLESYLKYAKIELDESLRKRIDNYYNWTAFRTAIFFLISHLNKPERADPLFKEICKNLGITKIQPTTSDINNKNS